MERIVINNLITKIGEGDEQAMTELYSGIGKAVYSFILTYIKDRYQAEDILQDTFMQVLKYKKVFNESDNGMAYIFTIARNLSLNYLKKAKRTHVATTEEIDVFSGATEGVSETNVILKEFLATLTEEERRVVILKEVYGFNFEEIRVTMKLSIATVKRRMADVKKKVKVFQERDTI